MAKQTFTASQVLTAAQMNSLQANDYNWTVDTKTDSYVLVAGDAGKRIVMNAATAKTITVNNSVFTAGDAVWIHNINTGTCTVTAGTATVNTAGSLALAQWEGGVLYFTSASAAIFFRGGGVGNADFSDAATGTYSSGGISYKYKTYTASGTLTTTKAGYADILVVGGGGSGGGGQGSGGGGAGGHLLVTNAFLPVGTLTVTVGAGAAGGSNVRGSGQVGNGSRLSDYYSAGGGGGGGIDNWIGGTRGRGLNGASGGGGSGDLNGASGSGTTGIGNDGGTQTGASQGAGGGGGSSAAGSNTAGTTGGAGGAGTSSSLDNVATTRCGGGGGGSNGGAAGAGGTGGGGGGGNPGTAGTANTGGGGGGNTGAGNTGGAGGSGIVIVRVRT